MKRCIFSCFLFTVKFVRFNFMLLRAKILRKSETMQFFFVFSLLNYFFLHLFLVVMQYSHSPIWR